MVLEQTALRIDTRSFQQTPQLTRQCDHYLKKVNSIPWEWGGNSVFPTKYREDLEPTRPPAKCLLEAVTKKQAILLGASDPPNVEVGN